MKPIDILRLLLAPPVDLVPAPKSRILARSRLCRMKMRKMGILSTAGYTPPPKGENIQKLWMKHGWKPVHDSLEGGK